MSTKVTLEIINALTPKTERNRALVILKDNELTNGDTHKIINTLTNLNDAVVAPAADDTKLKELQQIEYLLNAGVSTVLFKPTEPSELETELEELLDNNLDNLNFKIIVAPNIVDEQVIGKIAALVKSGVVEYYVNTVDKDGITALDTEIRGNRNVTISFGEAKLISKSRFEDSTGDTYILAAVAAQARKIKLLEANKAYQPVAGEDQVFNEFESVRPKISNKVKEELQTLLVNPLINKIGVGIHFVAQNTRNKGTATNPLNRSHANTLTNSLIETFRIIGDSIHQRPNTVTTWNSFELQAKKIFADLVKADGVEKFAVVTGKRLMSEQDIATGVFKAQVHFLPVRVIEAVQLNIVVHDNFETIIEIEGEE